MVYFLCLIEGKAESVRDQWNKMKWKWREAKGMALLLGPPILGKTTLLLALAGRLGKDLKVSFSNCTYESESFKAYNSFNSIADELQFLGWVSYNGHGIEEFVPQRTSNYIS